VVKVVVEGEEEKGVEGDEVDQGELDDLRGGCR
jgi:hypothetical protein